MESIITGVAIGVIMVGVNLIVMAVKSKKGHDKAAIALLLKCNLVTLESLQKTGLVNGDCDGVCRELKEFLIRK